MKNLSFTILILTCCFSISGQEPLSYTQIFETDSVGKTAIFVAINDWMATNYNSATDVLQMADKDAGIFIGKAVMKYTNNTLGFMYSSGYIEYTIKIYIKENRFKVELLNFTHKGSPEAHSSYSFGLLTTSDTFKAPQGMWQNGYDKTWDHIKQSADSNAKSIMLSMEKLASEIKKYNETSQDNW